MKPQIEVDSAPGALSVYDPTPEQIRAARLRICTDLNPTDARRVLEALGLVEPLTPGAPRTKDGLGKTRPTKATP